MNTEKLLQVSDIIYRQLQGAPTHNRRQGQHIAFSIVNGTIQCHTITVSVKVMINYDKAVIIQDRC